jgi:hypothetical protein
VVLCFSDVVYRNSSVYLFLHPESTSFYTGFLKMLFFSYMQCFSITTIGMLIVGVYDRIDNDQCHIHVDR